MATTETVKPTPYRGAYRAMIDRPEPVEAVEPEPVEGEPVTPANAEDASWQKRYGDLRRHTQKVETDLKARVKQLEDQVRAATQTGIKLPRTEAELTAWMQQYPDVAAFIETIALKKIGEREAEFARLREELQEDKATTARERAEARLMRRHPDFDEIRNDPKFHAWAEKQSKLVQRALYEEDDPDACADALDLYKAFLANNKPKAKNTRQDEQRQAAELIPARTRTDEPPVTDPSKRVYKESEIAVMTPRQFEKLEEDIDAARREGRIEYDLSGGAR